MSRKLLKSTAVVSGMTMISRVLGFVRDMIIARMFGATGGTDAFFVAFRIPNFMRRLFAEGAFSQAFVPVLSEYKAQRTPEETQHLVEHVMGTLGGILLLVTIVGMLAAPLLVAIFAPGFVNAGDKFDLAGQLLRITFPYLLFISLTALAGAVLNTYGRFGVPAFTPVFLNICMIVAALWVSPYMEQPVSALAWGVFVAGIVQLVFQFPYLAKLKLLRWPRWGWSDLGVKRIVNLMLPAIFGSSIYQINLLYDTVVASFLVTGSVTWLYYSDRMVEFPLGVFGIALATVILPHLSKNHAEKSQSEFAHTLDWGLRLTLLIGVPAAIGMCLLAGPILATLFMYGSFTAHDQHMAALSLMTYAPGLLAFILVKVLAPGFYARQDTKTPVKFAVATMFSNMAMTALFVIPLYYFDAPAPHAGLTLSSALASYLNAYLLYHRLRKDGVYTPLQGWGKLLTQLAVASGAVALLLWFGVPDADVWAQWRAFERAWHLLAWIGAAAALYVVCLLAMGVNLRHLARLRKS